MIKTYNLIMDIGTAECIEAHELEECDNVSTV